MTYLREWLFKRKISISEFAKLLDINRSYLHNILNGKHVPSKKLLNRVREITLSEIKTFEDLVDKRGEHG